MPTYQYACTACGEQLEAVQKFSDAPLTDCPQCAGSLRKVFSAVGIVFKGSGFYRTDNRSSNSSKSTTSTTSAAGDSSKTESAPAAKSESAGSAAAPAAASSSTSAA
ncbi:FmdB family zinc ribbon protein [Microtetraspora malaysiensis]|uniref:FmdB family zinc ribbon protein n=1 Tax=Microtetraspora malaysiensis TaxID=161358 RepID=UPI003D8D2451